MKDLYRSTTVDSGHGLVRWSHRGRFAKALTLLAPQSGERILDYGAGNCFLVAHIKKLFPSVEIVAFEPKATPVARQLATKGGFSLIETEGELECQSFDKILCLETLEHVHNDQLDGVINRFETLLRPGGDLIVSVPNELWLVGWVKNVVRLASGTMHEGTTLRFAGWMLLGRTEKVPRYEKDGQYLGHIGFDYRRIVRRLLASRLNLVDIGYSPLTFGGTLLNSQVFLRMTRRR
jgi:2-polyprenyl-3-methyl-5-hydroxy-6-metoxy-1,4-benzoquinol methylase